MAQTVADALVDYDALKKKKRRPAKYDEGTQNWDEVRAKIAALTDTP